MSHDLQINLLGQFSMVYRGEPLTFATDKARAVLAYLLLQGAERVPRLRLAAFFWPELVEQNALKNLRQTLYVLRSGLKPLLDDHPNLLITERTAVGLALGGLSVQSDVQTFDALVSRCQIHVHSAVETCSVCRPSLQQAADLFAGELLAGLNLGDVSNEFEHWLQAEQHGRHQAALWVSGALALHAYAIGNHALAQRHARRVLTLEPWHEPANRLLMQIHAAAGHDAGMRAQYIFLQRQLARALNTHPDAETQALYERLRAGNLSRPTARTPEQTTPFFGRGAELDRLTSLLIDPAYRLVTLIGEGGIGKTRLAIAAAHRVAHSFPDGAVFVPLATVTADHAGDLNSLPAAAICTALAWLPNPQQPIGPQLLNHLRPRTLLLILDNLEQLPDADQFILSLLEAAPGLTLLATSRRPIGPACEYLLTLGGLAATPDADRLPGDGLALLAERVARSGGGAALSADDLLHAPSLCQFVGGNPLALELAAPLVQQLGVAQALEAIRANHRLLAAQRRDRPERQHSMQAVMESSWLLLTPSAQQLLACLSVFEGAFPAAAVAAVAEAAADLPLLVTFGMLQHVGAERYLLHELLRQFAAEKLAALDDPATPRDRHAAHFLGRLRDLEASLWRSNAVHRELLADWDDMQAAWLWAAQRDQYTLLQQANSALALLCRQVGCTAEFAWLLTTAVELLQAAQVQQPHDQRLATLLALQDQRIALALLRHDIPWVEAILPEAQAQAQALGVPELQMLLYTREASLAMSAADTTRLVRATERARQLAAGLPVRPLHLLLYEQLGIAAYSRRNWQLAEQYLQQAVETALANNWLWGAGISLLILATHYRTQGALDRALVQHDHIAELMQAFPQQSDRGLERFHRGLIAYLLGRHDEARTAWTQAVPALQEIDRNNYVVRATVGLALSAAAQADRAGAQRAAEQALRLAHQLADPILIAMSSLTSGRLLAEQGQLIGAVPLIDDALHLAEPINQPVLTTTMRAEALLLALGRNDLSTAVALAETVLPALPDLEYTFFCDPARIHLLCYRALAAADDPRAAEVLAAAHAFLDQYARRIADPAVRREFLNGFASHRELQHLVGSPGIV